MMPHLPALFFPLALGLMTLAERALIDEGRQVVLGLAAVLVAATWARLVWHAIKHRGEQREVWLKLMVAYGQATLGLVLYGAYARGLLRPMGEAQTLVQVVWPALVAWGLIPALWVERALVHMAEGPILHPARLIAARRSGRLVVVVLITFAAVNYVAARHAPKVDLSYFRTSRVGEATGRIAEGLTQPVYIVLFFPPANEVALAVRTYVQELARHSPHIVVESLDHALAPERARLLKVRHNGTVALSSGEHTELIELPLDFEEARTPLRNLDGELQRRLVQVIRPPRVLYVTTGHLERDIAPPARDLRPGLGDFKALAEHTGFVVRRLGLAEGLGNEVPADAALVAVMGPSEPFGSNERAAIARYLARGGRVLMALDAAEGALEEPLLKLLGVRVGSHLIANAHFTVRIGGQADSPYNLVTTRISGHPSTRTLEHNAGRMGLVLLGAAPLFKLGDVPAALRQVATVWAMPDSWEDLTANRRFDAASEQRGSYTLAMAIEGKVAEATEATRAIVIGDVDFAVRGVARNPGNASFIRDGLRWLVGTENEAGLTESEEDVPLVYRSDTDALWFYGVTFGAPLLVLAIGLRFGPRRAPVRLRRSQRGA